MFFLLNFSYFCFLKHFIAPVFQKIRLFRNFSGLNQDVKNESSGGKKTFHKN